MLMRRFLLVLSFLVASLHISAAQSISDHEAQKNALQKEIEMIDRQLAANKSRQKDNTQQLQLVRRKISNRQEIVSEINSQISLYNRQISDNGKAISRMEAEMDTLLLYYEHLIRTAYRNRDSKLWFAYIFSGDNLAQTFRRYSYFKNLSHNLDVRAEEIKTLRQKLSEEKTRLEELRTGLVRAKGDKEREISSLKKEEKSAKALEVQLSKNRRAYERQLAQKRKEVKALEDKIRRLVEEAMKGKEGETTIDYALSGEFSANKGKLPWPTDSHTVIEGFGEHYHPSLKGVKLPYNNGVNILTAPDAEVRAIFDGVVKQVVVMPGYNLCVLVQHGGYFSFYCKLGAVAVKAGQTVKTGDKIGNVDTINGDTIFHFQIWDKDTPLNPELWLR